MTTNRKLAGLMLAPFVVGARLPIMWLEAMNPDPRRRAETNRAVAEKVAALGEGMVASQIALGAAVAEASCALMLGLTPKGTPQRVAEEMMRAGLAPAAKRVRANHRRLGRR